MKNNKKTRSESHAVDTTPLPDGLVYDFARHTPPALNRRALEAALARRTLRRQTALAGVTGMLLLLAALGLGLRFRRELPLLSSFFLAYSVLSVIAGSLIALLPARKGGC